MEKLKRICIGLLICVFIFGANVIAAEQDLLNEGMINGVEDTAFEDLIFTLHSANNSNNIVTVQADLQNKGNQSYNRVFAKATIQDGEMNSIAEFDILTILDTIKAGEAVNFSFQFEKIEGMQFIVLKLGDYLIGEATSNLVIASIESPVNNSNELILNTETESYGSSTVEESPSVEEEPSVEEANAVKAAKSYLNFMPFSRKGLIQQLEYEKFSTSAAEYGVDHCGADWNEQAVKKAKSYLDFMAFSYDRLVEQLKFDGFSDEEAAYGASGVY